MNNSRVTLLIDTATSPELTRPDLALIAQVTQELTLKTDK